MAREDFEITGSKPVGRGAFGTVFAARRISDGRPVALKVVLHAGEWGAERIEAERKGAILQQRFANANGMVPEVFDFGADGDDFFIAMEFIEGMSLEARLRRGQLRAEEAAGHALWLCGFLERAHAFCGVVDGKPYRIVHTDLKPAHLMLSPDGDRKVLDFGIAKALEESRELGTDIGRTIAYASPERLISDQISPHADFWSLGVMLYEMVCGHRPYPHLEGPRSRRDLEHAITSNAPRAVFPDSCPRTLGAIINKLLAFQVEHRYPDAAAIKADLQIFLDGGEPAALSIYETPATMPVQRTAISLPTTPATLPRPALTGIPPTEPRHFPAAAAAVDVIDPGGAGDAAAAVPADPQSTEAAVPASRKTAMLRRVIGAAPMLAIVIVVATEGVAWMFAERFRDTMAAMDERSVTDRREAYDAVDGWALFDIGLRARVRSRLEPALVAVGDRVIADYRREEPVMGPSEWQQAYEAFTWALEMSSRSAVLRGKQLTAAAHVKRFEAQAARGSTRVLLSEESRAIFRKAAEANPESFDPYLGIARLEVYEFDNVDAAATAIDEAVKRGYVPGRREAALLGDGYLRRGTAARRRASVLTGEQQRRELASARADFQRCINYFDPIVAFGNAAENLEICKAQLQRIDRQLVSMFFDDF